MMKIFINFSALLIALFFAASFVYAGNNKISASNLMANADNANFTAYLEKYLTDNIMDITKIDERRSFFGLDIKKSYKIKDIYLQANKRFLKTNFLLSQNMDKIYKLSLTTDDKKAIMYILDNAKLYIIKKHISNNKTNIRKFIDGNEITFHIDLKTITFTKEKKNFFQRIIKIKSLTGFDNINNEIDLTNTQSAMLLKALQLFSFARAMNAN